MDLSGGIIADTTLIAAIEQAADCILITDRAGIITYVNPAYSLLTGYSSAEAVGQSTRMHRSGVHSASLYRELWETICSGRKWQGELTNRRKDGTLYQDEMQITPVRGPDGEISHFIAIKKDVSGRRQFLAHHDALTGLPQRSVLEQRLDQAINARRREGERIALLSIDLDRFKSINDTFGHGVGDALLHEVGERLRHAAREQDTVARLGGDEFLIMLNGVAGDGDASLVAERIMGSIGRGFVIQGHSLNVGCCIGISMYPDHGADGQTLIKNADTALYAAKERGRGNLRFFDHQMETHATERLRLERSLRKALERDEFFLVYQPQVEFRAGRVTGLEALIRWRHPQLGLVSPDQFIPVAENSGLILPLGEWVLRTACAQARAWQRRGLPRVPIAVNVSAVQFRQVGFLGLIESVLTESGLTPDCLELELTEGLLLSDAEATSGVIRQLKEMGVRLAIDDFGTGYSSFNYLKQLRFGKLKIDRSFIRDLASSHDDAAITAAIISMANILKVDVIAEGVETETQMSFLRRHGCDGAQGFFISKPMTAEYVPEMLLRRTRLADPALPAGRELAPDFAGSAAASA